MALRQYSKTMVGLGDPKPVTGMMYGGTQGRPMLLHNAATGSVNGGMNPLGTSPMGRAMSAPEARATASQGTSAQKPAAKKKATKKPAAAPLSDAQQIRRFKPTKVNTSKIDAMYRDSIYDKNMSDLLQGLQQQLFDLSFQRKRNSMDYGVAKKTMGEQNMVDRMRANANAGMSGAANNDTLVVPTIRQNALRYAEMVNKNNSNELQLLKQMNLAKKYYNMQKLAQESAARERYQYLNGG